MLRQGAVKRPLLWVSLLSSPLLSAFRLPFLEFGRYCCALLVNPFTSVSADAARCRGSGGECLRSPASSFSDIGVKALEEGYK
jgi:hypothetical protein